MPTMQDIEAKLAHIVNSVGTFDTLIQKTAAKMTEIVTEFQALEADYRGVLEQLKGMELLPQILDMITQIEARLESGNIKLQGVLDSIVTHPITDTPEPSSP